MPLDTMKSISSRAKVEELWSKEDPKKYLKLAVSAVRAEEQGENQRGGRQQAPL